jgi:hypothetical protein
VERRPCLLQLLKYRGWGAHVHRPDGVFSSTGWRIFPGEPLRIPYTGSSKFPRRRLLGSAVNSCKRKGRALLGLRPVADVLTRGVFVSAIQLAYPGSVHRRPTSAYRIMASGRLINQFATRWFQCP